MLHNINSIPTSINVPIPEGIVTRRLAFSSIKYRKITKLLTERHTTKQKIQTSLITINNDNNNH